MKALKQFRTSAIWVLVSFTLNLLFVEITWATNPPQQCETYAKNAVGYQQSNLARHCGFTGARWQDNYNNHYSWCLNTSPISLNNEQSIRGALMGVCAKNPTALRCETYALKAVAQIENAAARRCAVDSGPRWTGSYEDHLAWCTDTALGKGNFDDANSETTARDAALTLCTFSNQPPPASHRCVSDCSVCVSQNLLCTNSIYCGWNFPTTTPWACY